MLDLLAQRTQIAQGAKLTGSRLDGIRVALRHKWLIVRSSALGAALGILPGIGGSVIRSEEHTSELQSLMRNSYAVFCLNNKILMRHPAYPVALVSADHEDHRPNHRSSRHTA